MGVALATTTSFLAMGWMCVYFYCRMIRPAKASLWRLRAGDFVWLRGQLSGLVRRIPILRSKFGSQPA
jgi:hypothetical protein